MAPAVTAALDARLGRGLRPIVLKAETPFARNVCLTLIIRISREWKPAKGMSLKWLIFKEKDPEMCRTATSYTHAIFNKHQEVFPRTSILTQLQYRLWRGKQTIYLLKNLSNSSPHLETKSRKPKNKTNTNANPSVVIRYWKFRLNGIIWRLARVHRIRYNPGHECQLANVVHTPRSAPSKYFMKRSEKTLTCSCHCFMSSLIDYRTTFQPIGHRNSVY